jgi:hypothetical protein
LTVPVGVPFGVGDREIGSYGFRAIGEQPDSLCRWKRRNRAQDLSQDAERFAAGGQNTESGAIPEQVFHQPRRRIDHMFAVVQHHQSVGSRKRVGQSARLVIRRDRS